MTDAPNVSSTATSAGAPALPDYAHGFQPQSAIAAFFTQTTALFVDAYRELNNRKLFWITLVLSLFVVVAFAFVGINERGFTIFGKLFPSVFNSNIIPREQFYKYLFTGYAIPWWLGFFAMGLALISVGSIFPDMLTGGSVDLYLAKPIGRARLFLTKYMTGLLFVALQVFVFCIASFLVIGIRGGSWEFGIFLGVPLVTLLFSYLFCVCALLGLLTRSALASILVTVLFWCLLMLLNTADAVMLVVKVASETEQTKLTSAVSMYQGLLDKQADLPADQRNAGLVKNYEFQRDAYQKQLVDQDSTVSQIRFWQHLIVVAKSPLPKTSATISLMSRWLVDETPIMEAQTQSGVKREERRAEWRSKNAPAKAPTTGPSVARIDVEADDPDVLRGVAGELTARSAAKIIGSSLAFEAVVLGVAVFVFCRRDY